MPKRTDKNQQEIVNYLRAHGVQVHLMHEVGRGFPDLLCVYRGEVVLIEVKRSRTDTINRLQIEFLGMYAGRCGIAWTPDIAMAFMKRELSINQQQKNLLMQICIEMKRDCQGTMSVQKLMAYLETKK